MSLRPTAGGLAAVGQLDWLADAERAMAEVTTTEARLIVTGLLGLLALVVAVGLAPLSIRYAAGLVDRRVSGRLARAIQLAGDYVPTTIGGLALRMIQISVLLLAIVTLLVVWGLVDVAVALLTVIGISIPLGVRIATTVGLFVGAYVGSDLLADAVDRFGEEADRVTKHQEEILTRVGHVSLLAVAVTGSLTIWGVNLAGLLVGAGFLGIVVGLAARQTLGSIIAGFVLMFSRPFTIGDWVEIGDVEGIVTDITIMNTRLENFDGEFIVLPNDMVGNRPITNRSKKGLLRIRVDVGIDYEADPAHAREVAREAMADVKEVIDAPPPQVVSKAFGDSAIVLQLRFWIDRPTPPRRWGAQTAVVQAVSGAFAAEGIKIPFPQRELSGRAEAGGFRLQDASDQTSSDSRASVTSADGNGSSGTSSTNSGTGSGENS